MTPKDGSRASVGSRGLIKIVVVVVIGVLVLWLIKFDIRIITDAAVRDQWYRIQKARVSYVWNGFQAWYDEQSRASSAMQYVQGKIDELVMRFDSSTSTAKR